MISRALEMDGTCTGEHGVGLGKKTALLSEVGNDTIMVMVSGDLCETNHDPTLAGAVSWPGHWQSISDEFCLLYQRLIKGALDPNWIM